MGSKRAGDLTVVIPTRARWPILARTLDALAGQTTDGFEVVVVVDGEDQEVPEDPRLLADRVLFQGKAGPGAARNLGVKATARPLLLFLGDDVIPTPGLVTAHLDAHDRFPDHRTAALGHTDWHPDVARGLHNRWLDWSASQFDFGNIVGEDAGWGRFYSSNASLKRELFEEAGGFDEAFSFDYEDLDLAYRLHGRGMRLVYAPEALAHHLHYYDWPSLMSRYYSRGQAERIMAEKSSWFRPWFASRLRAAEAIPPVCALWPRLAPLAGRAPAPVRRRVRDRATTWYHQQLAAPFFGGWTGRDDLEDLREYLGDSFDEERLQHHQDLVDEEERAAPDERTFYRTSNAYLYDLTMFAVWGTKVPYLAAVRRAVPEGARLLDYGCGTGSDGLRLLDAGYDVSFADFDNPSTRYLRWRLLKRGSGAPVYDVEKEVPGGFDLVYSFDVIEHIEDPFAFLRTLEEKGKLVAVNFLAETPGDTHLHRPLPLRRLLGHASRRGLLFYHRYGQRSHLVVYGAGVHGPGDLARSWHQRVRGRLHAAAERATGLPDGPPG